MPELQGANRKKQRLQPYDVRSRQKKNGVRRAGGWAGSLWRADNLLTSFLSLCVLSVQLFHVQASILLVVQR
jgi:hypothetical protein